MKYIVSDEHKFIYFVVQKVACTSVKTALAPLFGMDVAEAEANRPGKDTPRYMVHRLFRDSGYQIDGKQFLDRLDGEYKDYFKFAFVRNPWDRLVSCYSDKIFGTGRGMGYKPRAGVKLYRDMPFDEFVEGVHAIPDEDANSHFRSQYEVLCPRGDKQVVADFVGRFENLAGDFEFAMEAAGVTREHEIPHMLRSDGRRSRPYAEFYDDRLKKLVHERFRDDIEIFEYSF